MSFRSGIIAILGKPNVGKSTLLNALIGQKIAAVTAKPQTTRGNIRGIRHGKNSQMVFLDTPGFHSHAKDLNRWMTRQARAACEDADLTVILLSAKDRWNDQDRELLQLVIQKKRPYIIALNKVDAVVKETLLPMMEEVYAEAGAVPVLPISAMTADGLEALIEVLESRLPEGAPLYPEEIPTDQTMRELAAEWIREKLFDESHQEIPYSIAVQIESYEEPTTPDAVTRIGAVIYVERKSQKQIVIGKGGQLLKRVGTAARKELESAIGGKVFLKLFVKVAKDWTKDPVKRKELGYG